MFKKESSKIIALAPMAGYTDAAFRLICLENGADMVYSEMISVEAIWRENEKTLRMLDLLPNEKNVIIQLFGSSPESFARSAKFIEEYAKKNITAGKIIGLDINFGCPAKKVFNTGAGAALMQNLDLARNIIQQTIANTSLPVSVKIRAGSKGVTAIDFANKIKSLPISHLMIHGRTYEQGFSGPIDIHLIRELKKILAMPVLVNGGIDSPEKAREILDATDADGIGLATHVLGKPWLFAQTKAYLTKGKYKEPNFRQIKKIFTGHAKYFLQYSDDLETFRKHLLFYLKGLPHAKELRQQAVEVKSLKDVRRMKV